LANGRFWLESRQEQDFFSSTKHPHRSETQPVSLRQLSLEAKPLGCSADHSCSPSAKTKNSWSYTSLPHVFMACPRTILPFLLATKTSPKNQQTYCFITPHRLRYSVVKQTTNHKSPLQFSIPCPSRLAVDRLGGVGQYKKFGGQPPQLAGKGTRNDVTNPRSNADVLHLTH